jgi:hypothetical protein
MNPWLPEFMFEHNVPAYQRAGKDLEELELELIDYGGAEELFRREHLKKTSI